MNFFVKYRAPLLVFVLAFTVLAAFAGKKLVRHSDANHFVYLADGYLHGRLDMRQVPPNRNDWAGVEHITLNSGQELIGTWWDRSERTFISKDDELYEIERSEFPFSPHGIAERCPDDLPPPEERVSQLERRCSKYYVSFPPAPAVLMMPGVAIWGLAFNDVLFTVLIAALGAALLFVLLTELRERGKTTTTPAQDVALVIAFVLGSNYLWCSILGQVWYTALVCGTTFSIAYMLAAIDARAPVLAGLFLGLAFASRTPLLFAVVFFAYFFFFPDGKFRRDLRADYGREFWIEGMKFASAPLLIGFALMAANEARFGSLTEFGHTFLDFRQNYRINTYGLFNVYFLGMNISALLALLPKFLPEAPYIVVSYHGLALWFTTPIMLWAVWPKPAVDVPGPRGSTVSQTYYRRALVAAIAVIMVPHMFYHNPGWAQFGYRFSLDYLGFWFVLIAFSNHKMRTLFIVAILLGIVVNVFGAVTFQRAYEHYTNFFIEALPTAQGL